MQRSMACQFRAASGVVVAEPEIPYGERKEQRPAYWAGAPTAILHQDRVILCYRLRYPRGTRDEAGNDVERGSVCVLASSQDGFGFEERARLPKAMFSASSVEKCAPLPLEGGGIALYVSYASAREDEIRGQWCIDRVVAGSLEEMGACPSPERILAPAGCPALEGGWIVTGVKDPFFLTDEEGRFFFDGKYHMIVSFSKAPISVSWEIHQDGDCYASGQILSSTAYLTSEDGIHFNWEGEILPPSPGSWYGYAARITTMWRDSGAWIGIFDGAGSVAENYNERAGWTAGPDLRSLGVLSQEGPSLCPAYAANALSGGMGGVRYVSVVQHLSRTLFFFEFTRDDGSHDLRVAEARWALSQA